MKNWHIYIGLVVIVIIIVLVAARGGITDRPEKVTKFDDFAQCLADTGAVFYGAYWCPNCQDQKEMFDNSKKIPYIECSTPGGNAQTKQCAEKGIQGYPTWIFADGSETSGVTDLKVLAEKTGCDLPQ